MMRSKYQKEHGCLQRGPARVLQIQKQKLATKLGLSLGSPMVDLEGCLEGLKGYIAPWEEQ